MRGLQVELPAVGGELCEGYRERAAGHHVVGHTLSVFATSHGVPVVGTTAGAIPDTVPAAAGVLVAPDDIEALADTLQRLMENPADRERLAAGARAATFPSWPQQAALFARVLARVG